MTEIYHKIEELQAAAGTSGWNKAYNSYLRSACWRRRKKKVRKRDKGKCVRCDSKEVLHTHHTTYERVGQEFLSDLITLCDICHAEEHKLWGVPAKDKLAPIPNKLFKSAKKNRPKTKSFSSHREKIYKKNSKKYTHAYAMKQTNRKQLTRNDILVQLSLGATTINQIKNRIPWPNKTVGSNIDVLTKYGMVDRKKKTLSLTPKGENRVK